MPHTSIEYAIMIPVLLVQVILIPVAATWLVEVWAGRRKEVALQDVASHLGTTIQQLYFSLISEEIVPGTMIQLANVPSHIESIPYAVTASQRKIENSTRIELSLELVGTNTGCTSRVTLGPYATWEESTLLSNSTNPCIRVEKFSNGTLRFAFG